MPARKLTPRKAAFRRLVRCDPLTGRPDGRTITAKQNHKGEIAMLTRALCSVAALALTAGMAVADYKLTILHTNDIHSRIESINKYDSTCKSDDEAAGKCFGGVARIKTLVDAKRADMAGQNLLVMDAGDPFQGSLFYTTYKGAAEAEFMEAIGYDVMAVGNHEFDDGPAGLAAFVDAVSFPVISGNLDLSRSAELKGKVGNHVVLEVGGRKIGVVSALATDTVETSSPGGNVVFQDEIESLKADVAALESEGVDIIIALNHVGLAKDLEIAAAVPGLDLVIGGHSHTLLSNTDDRAAGPYPMMVGDVPVVQAYAYSKYVGEITLTFDDAGHVTSAGGAPILLDASVEPDAAIAARVAEMGAPIEEMKQRVVAAAAAAIEGNRSVCRVQECEMGNLVADAMLDRVKDQGASIAIANAGGLRASIDAGEVTMGEVLTVLPFQNTLSTFEITGATVVAALENGVSQVEEVKGRFPQVAGLKFTWDPSVAPNEGRISDVMVATGDGFAPIDMDKTYLVVTNNYVRNGGDGYKMFAGDDKNAYDFGPDLADVTAEYLAEHSPYQPYVDGRITRR
jgi:5'-nucleotidase